MLSSRAGWWEPVWLRVRARHPLPEASCRSFPGIVNGLIPCSGFEEALYRPPGSSLLAPHSSLVFSSMNSSCLAFLQILGFDLRPQLRRSVKLCLSFPLFAAHPENSLRGTEGFTLFAFCLSGISVLHCLTLSAKVTIVLQVSPAAETRVNPSSFKPIYIVGS